MLTGIRILEILISASDIISLSIALSRLANYDIVGAIVTSGIGALIVMTFAGVVIACEVARWYVRHILRKHE